MAIWACADAAALQRASANETVPSSDFIVMVFPPVLLLTSIVASPVPTSMRKRVEFPVGLVLPPALCEPIPLEYQKSDYNQPGRDLTQKRDFVVERQRPV